MKTSEIITQKIIEKLESGTIPWQKPWNLKTGRPQKACDYMTVAK